jgi:putative ABC transport system permease protein
VDAAALDVKYALRQIRRKPGTALLVVLTLGTSIGVVIAVSGGYLLRHLFYGLGAVDPIAYLMVALVLTLAGAAATYLPAQRALRVDPVVALRCE